jgi:hypothetical protein
VKSLDEENACWDSLLRNGFDNDIDIVVGFQILDCSCSRGFF